MRPGWTEERAGLWTWTGGGRRVAQLEVQPCRVLWWVADPTGRELGEGEVPILDGELALDPVGDALDAAAVYVGMVSPLPAVEDAELRERVLNTCLRPLAGRWEALGLLRGRMVAANAVGWLRDAEAAVVVERRGALELVAAWREDGEVCWYGGRLS